MTDLPILAQRRIEAAFAKGIYEEMKAEFGEDAARRILGKAVAKMARAGATALAEAAGSAPGLDGFRAVFPRWTADDALEVEVLQSTPTAFDFNVRRCLYAEMYRAMGIAELGAVLSCNRDAAFCDGYDPKLRLTRTQTIMQGASHCDFRYRYG